MKHTKGPWYPVNYGGYINLQFTDKYEETDLLNEAMCEEAIANGILASCAPKMLELLQVVLLSPAYEEAKKNYGQLESHWTNQIPLLITKATGGN